MIDKSPENMFAMVTAVTALVAVMFSLHPQQDEVLHRYGAFLNLFDQLAAGSPEQKDIARRVREHSKAIMHWTPDSPAWVM